MAEVTDHTTEAAEDHNGTVRLDGPLDLMRVAKVRNQLRRLSRVQRIDVSGITKLDTAGAMLLVQLAKKGIQLENMQEQHHVLYALVEKFNMPAVKKRHCQSPGEVVLVRLGQGAVNALKSLAELITFLGQASVSLWRVLREPKRLRISEIVHQIEHIGINAIPIISLVAFLISVVLAYQSIEQLRTLGAQKFTVDLITISVLREMGVLLTAIMVAGRSGSAFTAEIGVMKIREEVDALKAIGVDPFELLVVPRLIAIIIAVPLLTFIANMMGLLGGAILTQTLIDLPFDPYINRVHQVAGNGHALLVGMIKAPVFAFFIGIVGCMHGMKVSGSSESVGMETTNAVVKSIFLVLVLDAIFSIFFQKVGI